MPQAGSAPSPPRHSGEILRILLSFLVLLAAPAVNAQQVTYQIRGDSIPASLTGQPGDAGRGRAVVANRSTGLCLLCHSGPIAEERFQGDLSPSLAGAGSRWSEGQLRLRVVDNRHVNPGSSMPSFHRVDGLTRVGTAWNGRPVLTAQQVEDVVALLRTLRN